MVHLFRAKPEPASAEGAKPLAGVWGPSPRIFLNLNTVRCDFLASSHQYKYIDNFFVTHVHLKMIRLGDDIVRNMRLGHIAYAIGLQFSEHIYKGKSN